MEFELPLSNEQKKNIYKVLLDKNKGQAIGWMAMELFLSMIPAMLAAGGIISGYYYFVLVGIAIKYLGYILCNYILRADGTDMVYAKAFGFKCTIADIDTITLTEGAKRSDLTGERTEGLLFIKDYVWYELEGRKHTAKRSDLIIRDTEKLVTEGNREHLAILYGKNNNILIAASIIDSRFANMTIGELKEYAELAKNKGIENIDIDETIKNTSFKKATCKGRLIDKKEKRKLGLHIWKQFYIDYEGRSLKEELARRFVKFAVTVVGFVTSIFYVMIYIIQNKHRLTTGGAKLAEYMFYVFVVFLILNLIVYAGYMFFRNDICKWLSRTKEPRILHATMEYEGEEKKENVEHYKYKLITEFGDVIHNIYSRDDIYIHHRAQYGEVSVIVCDKMLAIYPKGYFGDVLINI